MLASLLAPGYVLWPTLRDEFRLPKLLAAQTLGLLSVLLLTLAWRRRVKWSWRDVLGEAAPRATGPFLLVAILSVAAAGFAPANRAALWSFSLALLCLWAWSAGAFDFPRLARLYTVGLIPLAVLTLFHLAGGYRPFETVERGRLSTTSLVGNIGELSALLVLPTLVAVQATWESRRSRLPMIAWGLAAGLLGTTVVLTETVVAALALGAGLAVWVWLHAPRRARFVILGGALLLALFIATGPLPGRFAAKRAMLAAGDYNALLTGRLDGYRVALELIRSHPVAGVGLGGYGAHFLATKELLLERDVPFFAGHGARSFFANAHNDFLEAVAETGLLGAGALLWCGWGIFHAWRRRQECSSASLESSAEQGVLLAAAFVALTVIAMAYFPLHLATTGFAATFFFAWVFSRVEARA